MTKQNAKEFLHLVQALADGKTIQAKAQSMAGGWYDYLPETDFYFDLKPDQYRIKPEPKLRPWRPEEVPVGALYRGKQWSKDERGLIVHSTGNVFNVGGISEDFTTQYAAKNGECSLDRGATWHPCGVMEDAA